MLLAIALGVLAGLRKARHAADGPRAPTTDVGAATPAAPVAAPLAPSSPVAASAPAADRSNRAGATPMARTLDRAYTALGAAARPCADRAPAGASPTQSVRHHVRIEAGVVTRVQRVDGDLGPAVVDCIEARWRGLRWPGEAGAGPVTMEVVTTLEQLRRGR